MIETRTEQDSLGPVEVPADRLWGAQTQRSLDNFRIGTERMPLPVIRALGMQKGVAAAVNNQLGVLPDDLARAILQASDEVIRGELDEHFPLVVWQTGSGTQSHMNVNEVIANRANILLGHPPGLRKPVHPNDHVNRGQSSNDSFPTAMHIATVTEVHNRLLPALASMIQVMERRVAEFGDVVKTGRTHLQDATPVTLAQEFSAFQAQLVYGADRIRCGLQDLFPLAQGGTAVGTGLNTHPRFAALFAEKLAQRTGLPFTEAENKFEALATHDAMVSFSGALNTLAVSVNKMANDIRLLGSGPRCGLGELHLPENEPGSSIMPGKVNPTQAEALTMVAAQVMGNHTTVTVAGAQGHLQLNVFKPVIVLNVLQSVALLADGINSFTSHCLEGLQPRRDRIQAHLDQSLMVVTALTPRIGYDQAARLAHVAHHEGISLLEAARKLDLLSEADFRAWVRPETMTYPSA